MLGLNDLTFLPQYKLMGKTSDDNMDITESIAS